MLKPTATSRTVLWVLLGVALVAGAAALYVDRASKAELVRPQPPTYTLPTLGQSDPPICVAAFNGDRARVADLLAAGAAADTRCSSDRTPLYLACAAKHFSVVTSLLMRGAQPFASDADGATPLHAAVGYGSSEMREGRSVRRADDSEKIVQVLLEQRAPVDLQDSSGDTPLIIAARNGRSEIVRQLLLAGAQREHRDSDGKTALDWALVNHHEEIVEMLRRPDEHI